MPNLLMVVTDIDGQTTLLIDKGIEHSDQKQTYAEINIEIKNCLLELFNELGIKAKVLALDMRTIDKGIVINLWDELTARVANYQGNKLDGSISQLLELKNRQRELFTLLPPFQQI